jgi:hypothetical protein
MAKFYERKELESLTVYKLREICREEVLVKSALFDLDREELIELILRYRGAGEPALIDEPAEGGMERLVAALTSSVRLSEGKDLEAPSKIVIYEGMDTTETDDLRIEGRFLPDPGVAFLMSGERDLCAIFGLKRGSNGELFIVRSGKLPAHEADLRNYSLWCMDTETTKRIRDLWRGDKADPEEYDAIRLSVLDFAVRKAVSTETPLAIDFGTTNTTMGILLDGELAAQTEKQGGLRGGLLPGEVNPVCVMRKDGFMSPLIPTVACALDVSEEDAIYAFGEEALSLSTSVYAQEGLTVFFDIKRWISSPDTEEEVIDKTGRRRLIPRKKIIGAYLNHIIASAEQYYKCRFKNVHISAPVKQRHKFHDLFKELLPERNLCEPLDEGAAVLYNSVAGQIASDDYENGREYRTLIVDCGGGTTDLSSCRYRIENRKIGYRVTMETVYENGDVNFGGNSLTYRLLQILKIMAAERLAGKAVMGADAVWDSFEKDAYRFVDEHGTDEYYGELERRYADVERLIPTRFKEWEKRGRDEYIRVKSNFYEFFRLAEQIKERFFQSGDALALRILSKDDFEAETRRSRDAGPPAAEPFVVPPWSLSVANENGALEKRRDWPGMTISIRQIERLFAADIYSIMKKFLEKPYWGGELQDLNGIRLTGQSCKIGLFRDVLKEFVPGMLLSFGGAGADGDNPYSLKLTCLYGALRYLHASRGGFVKVDMQRRQPFLPYLLVADTHERNEKILINSLDPNKLSGHVSRHLLDLSLSLKLRDSDGTPKHDFVYHNEPASFESVTHEKLAALHDFIPQDETDDIVEDEVKFFVSAKPDDWGFVVVPVARKREGLLLGKTAFFTFEDAAWETDYFDGMK